MHAFYDAAIATGATCEGPLSLRPAYGEPYYSCFVRDSEGHKIEATFCDAEMNMQIYSE